MKALHIRASFAAFLFLFSAIPVVSAQDKSDGLRRFLQSYAGSDALARDSAYNAKFVDLRGDGKQEVLVYLSSNFWCGTAGCTMLVLLPEGSSYKVITRIPAVRLPVRVLRTKTGGWYDLSVMERTSALEPLKEVTLSSDGNSYPSNINDADPAKPHARGKVAIGVKSRSTPLFPESEPKPAAR